MSPVSMGQASPGSEAAAPAIDDWSYHHVVFSKPATAEQARLFEQDPRYWQQIRRRRPLRRSQRLVQCWLPSFMSASAVPVTMQDSIGTGRRIWAPAPPIGADELPGEVLVNHYNRQLH